MQRLGNAWLLHRFPARTRSLLRHGQVRYVHHKIKWPKVTRVPMRNRFPTFEASTLVLDLDAEDNEHVRPFNRTDDGELESRDAKRKRDTQPMMERVAEFEAESQSDEANFAKVKTDIFNPWRVSDLDLFSAAMFGIPSYAKYSITKDLPESAEGFDPGQISVSVLVWNGIQRRARDSTSKTIPYMLRRQAVSERHKSGVPLDRHGFCQAIEKCESLIDLERVVSPFVQTPSGQAFVAKRANDISRRCQSLRNGDPSSAAEILSFMNNLVINLKLQGLPLSTTFGDVGLDLSLEYDNFVAVQRYIDTCYHDSSQSPEVDSVLKVLRTVLKSLDGLQQGLIESGSSATVPQRYLEIYSLLTGWDFGSKTVKPFFRDFYHRNYQTRLLYFTCLARLGAFRTMWHEWQISCLEDSSEQTTSEADSRVTMSWIYADAILGSQGVARNAGELLSCVDFAKPSAKPQGDRLLEVEAIVKLAEMRTRPAASAAYSVLYEDGKYEGIIAEVFSHKDILKTLQGLRDLLTQMVGSQDTIRESIRGDVWGSADDWDRS
ncbi:hypothetical protein MGN70_011340 [Eutypa lata]|nr:hypothetical protein MGN70_011340 [Eutypa lata]